MSGDVCGRAIGWLVVVSGGEAMNTREKVQVAFFVIASILGFSWCLFGEDRTNWNEVQWSRHLAESIHAESEYRLQDGSRIDIYQPGVCAWECEWCSKWEQAFGQAAFYAASTDTTPGIWLLKRGKEDDEDFLRFLTTLHFYRSQGVKIKWQVTEVGR